MVVGISLIKDEIDIIDRTIGWMASQLDMLLVADNGSTDGTREVLEHHGCEIRDDDVVGYYQSEKMTGLAAEAFQRGATWILPFDADEVWLQDDARFPISRILTDLPNEANICEAALLDHVATGDPEMPWRRKEQLPLRKVACRAEEGLVIHQGNHAATFPSTATPLSVTGRLEIRHFPYRSVQQFIRKARNGAAAYAATDLDESVGKHWRDYGKLTDEQLAEVFYEWFHSADPENDPKLVLDPCPALLRS